MTDGSVGFHEPLGGYHSVEPLETADGSVERSGGRRSSTLSSVLGALAGNGGGWGSRKSSTMSGSEGDHILGSLQQGEEIRTGFTTFIDDHGSAGRYDTEHESAKIDVADPGGVGCGRKGRYCGYECTRRRCVVYSVLSVVGFLGVLVLSLVLAAPTIGEAELEASNLEFEQLNISDPDANGFTITARAKLWNIGPTDGRLEAFDATMSFGGVPFGKTRLPELSVKAGVVNDLLLSHRVEVTDPVTFSLYATGLLAEKSVSFEMSGRVTVWSKLIGDWWVKVPNLKYNKVLPVKGAQGLHQSNVTSVSLADSTKTEVVLELGVGLYNPSNVNILGVGSVCLDLFYNDTLSGEIVAQNADLLEGQNNVFFKGQLIDTDPVLVSTMISTFLGGNASNVRGEGRHCDGTSPLFRAALASLALDTVLPGSPIPLIRQLEVSGIFMLPSQDLQSVLIDMNTTITINSVLGEHSPLVVDTVALDASLTGAGANLGKLDVPTVHVTSTTHSPLPFSTPPPLLLSSTIPPPPVWPVNVSLRLNGKLHLNHTEGAFESFVEQFMTQPEVEVGLRSNEKTAVRVKIESALGTLHVAVPIDITSRMAGAANFAQGLEVVSFDVDGPTLDGKGLIVTTDVILHNPSPATVDMGKETVFEVLGSLEPDIPDSPLARIGFMQLYNTTVYPGRNPMRMLGELRPAKFEGGMAAASVLFSRYLAGVSTRVSVHGVSIEMEPGLPTPMWMIHAVKNMTLQPVLPGVSDLTILSDIKLVAVNMSFEEDNSILSSAHVHALVHVPFTDVPFDILAVNATMSYLSPKTMKPMASVTGIDEGVIYKPFPNPIGPGPYPASGALDLFLTPPSILTVIDEEEFGNFLAEATTSKTVTVLVTAEATQRLRLPVGVMEISNISATESITVGGMDSFHINVVGINVQGSDGPDCLRFAVTFNITNPSRFTTSLGAVTFFVEFMGQRLGNATLPNLYLPPGSSILVADAIVVQGKSPETDAALRVFLSNYLSQRPTTFSLLGDADSMTNPVLRPAMRSLVSNTTLPGLTEGLVINGTLILDDWDKGDVMGTIALQNPTNKAITVTDAKLYVYMCAKLDGKECVEYGGVLGMVTNVDISKDPITIQPRGVMVTRPLPLELDASFGDMIEELLQLALNDDSVPCRVHGNMTATVGEFTTNVEYFQDGPSLHASF